MKLTLAFLTIAICLFTSTEGIRRKRTLAHEQCPKNVDCEAYAKKAAEILGSCSSYGTDGKWITYSSCGNAYCEENTRLVEDLSKPFPECCPDCEIIDPSKPAKFGRTL